MLRFLLTVTGAVFCAASGLCQNPGDDAALVDLGHPVELPLAGGQKKTARIRAGAGDYLRITAESDSQLVVKTSLFDPSGNLVAVTPSLGGTGGSAKIAAYADAAGDFRIEITSQMPSPEVRICTVTLAERRAGSEMDRIDAEAHRAFAKAAAQAAGGAAGMRAAVGALDQPIELAHRSGDEILELRAVFGKGQFLAMLGDLPSALPFFEQSLQLSREAGDKRAEAHTLDDLGLVETNLERYNDAIGQFRQALELEREIRQPWETALTLANLAEAESALGRVDLALESLQQQEQIRKDIHDDFGLSETWLGMADVYLMTGDPEQALEKLVETLPHWPHFRDKEDGKESEIAAYRKLGAAYAALGDYDSANAALRTALKLAQALDSKRVTAETLVAAAQLYPLRGYSAQAWETAEEALVASRAAEYRRGEALSLVELGKLAISAGRVGEAAGFLEEAREISTDLGQPYDEANEWRALGQAHAHGETNAAERDYAAALAIERRIGDRFGEVQTLVQAAQLADRLEQSERALEMLESAVSVIDKTRSSLAAPELRASYLASQRAAYELTARILMRLHEKQPSRGYDLRAFDISERAHARTLLDALGQTHGELEPGNRALTAQLDAVDASLHLLASSDESPHREARIAELMAKRNQLELESPFPESSAPIPLPAIREKLLDKNTILLEYLMGSQQSHLWVVSRTSFQHYALPRETALRLSVRRLYDSLTRTRGLPIGPTIEQRDAALASADSVALREATVLSRALLPMPSAALGKGAILIVADGPLQMIPFALLPDPGNPNRRLGSVHNIAVEPSASVLARIRENPAPATDGRILIVAEPVFSRSTSDRRLASLPPLPMSRVEAEQISKLASGRAGALMGFLATRDGFRKTAAGAFSVIHIATHTLLDDRHPDLSGLVLSLVDREGHSQDGFLPLLDIYKLRLRAHLVVLSACDTYIGKDLRGEGLLGLARGFLYAGARQVVASLWKVDDRATAVFMQRFYTALLHDNLTAPEALRRAQEEVSQEPAWRSPRYWAGFVLAGDLQ